MSYAANIEEESVEMAKMLMNYVEGDACQEDMNGHSLTVELMGQISSHPNFKILLQEQLISLYAEKIGQLCDRAESVHTIQSRRERTG